MRKFITFLLVGLVFSPLTLATSKNQAVSDLVSRGIIREKTDHRLEDPLLRQELIGMLMSGMFGGLGNACLGYYDDVSASFPNTWICPVVEAAADKGIISRSNHNFRPEAPLTNAETLSIALDSLCLNDRVPAQTWDSYAHSFSGDYPDWQKKSIINAHIHGIIPAAWGYDPDHITDRGSALVYVSKILGIESACDNQDSTTGVTVEQESNETSRSTHPDKVPKVSRNIDLSISLPDLLTIKILDETGIIDTDFTGIVHYKYIIPEGYEEEKERGQIYFFPSDRGVVHDIYLEHYHDGYGIDLEVAIPHTDTYENLFVQPEQQALQQFHSATENPPSLIDYDDLCEHAFSYIACSLNAEFDGNIPDKSVAAFQAMHQNIYTVETSERKSICQQMFSDHDKLKPGPHDQICYSREGFDFDYKHILNQQITAPPAGNVLVENDIDISLSFSPPPKVGEASVLEIVPTDPKKNLQWTELIGVLEGDEDASSDFLLGSGLMINYEDGQTTFADSFIFSQTGDMKLYLYDLKDGELLKTYDFKVAESSAVNNQNGDTQGPRLFSSTTDSDPDITYQEVICNEYPAFDGKTCANCYTSDKAAIIWKHTSETEYSEFFYDDELLFFENTSVGGQTNPSDWYYSSSLVWHEFEGIYDSEIDADDEVVLAYHSGSGLGAGAVINYKLFYRKFDLDNFRESKQLSKNICVAVE